MLTFILGGVVAIVILASLPVENRNKIINYFDLQSKFRK